MSPYTSPDGIRWSATRLGENVVLSVTGTGAYEYGTVLLTREQAQGLGGSLQGLRQTVYRSHQGEGGYVAVYTWGNLHFHPGDERGAVSIDIREYHTPLADLIMNSARAGQNA